MQLLQRLSLSNIRRGSQSKTKHLRPQIKRDAPRVKKGKPEMRLLYLAVAFFLFGLLMIYSASAVVADRQEGSSFHYFFRQLIWLVGGLMASYIAYIFPINQLPKLAPLGMIVALVGLVAVLVIGEDINGAKRWIYIGDFSLQPSEMAKLAFVIYLAAWLAKTRSTSKKFKEALRDHFYKDILPFILIMGVVCVLILAQPDLDTTVIIAITALTVYFVSGRDAIHSIGTAGMLFLGGIIGIAAAVVAPYRLKRVQVYVEFLTKGSFTIEQKRNEAFQVWNGLLAISNGGLFGVGYGQSTQKLFYLQETAWTDSIFAVIAEEFGLLGSVIIILAFLYFLSLGIEIAMSAKDRFSSLLAVGVTTWIALQGFLNIGANLALVPFGGIPLPFLSYGGSNTIVVMVGVAILLNISRDCKERAKR